MISMDDVEGFASFFQAALMPTEMLMVAVSENQSPSTSTSSTLKGKKVWVFIPLWMIIAYCSLLLI